eukprot:scaffold29855_cov113-Isochrysis_galbana.AAC.1
MGHMLCGLSPKASAKASTNRIVFTAPKRRSPLAADFDRIACAMIASGAHSAPPLRAPDSAVPTTPPSNVTAAPGLGPARERA